MQLICRLNKKYIYSVQNLYIGAKIYDSVMCIVKLNNVITMELPPCRSQ